MTGLRPSPGDGDPLTICLLPGGGHSRHRGSNSADQQYAVLVNLAAFRALFSRALMGPECSAWHASLSYFSFEIGGGSVVAT